jgi:hypothetical protein
VNSATDRDYHLASDLEDTVRRPISVAQLLEREGFRPTERSRAAKRALSGVTAGAVLALGAVVSTLFLNHGQTTSGDTLASGAQSGGDIVLAESSPAAGAPVSAARTAVATAGSHLPAKITVPDVTTVAPAKAAVPDNSGHVRVQQNRATAPAKTTPATSQTQAAMQSAPATTTPAAPATTPDTTSNATASTVPTAPLPPTTTTTAPPTTTTTPPPATTTPPAPSTTTDSGLLGNVTGALDGVTQPVFNWFGG